MAQVDLESSLGDTQTRSSVNMRNLNQYKLKLRVTDSLHKLESMNIFINSYILRDFETLLSQIPTPKPNVVIDIIF